MPSVTNGDSVAIIDTHEPSSTDTDVVLSHSDHMNPQGSVAAVDMADMAADRQDRRQVTVSVRPTDAATGHPDVCDPQQDQRQHAGGQPLPPTGRGDGAAVPEERSTTRSVRAPSLSNLSDYARSMLMHTKQQMDATSGSPPPVHLHVAGPAGNGQRYRSGSLSMSMNAGPVSSSHNTSSYANPSYSRGTSQSTSPSRSQHHHNHSSHRHLHRSSLVNGTLPNGI
jgi:hypothetical protein